MIPFVIENVGELEFDNVPVKTAIELLPVLAT